MICVKPNNSIKSIMISKHDLNLPQQPVEKLN